MTLELPPLSENGNTVPLTVRVESPMTEAEHVRAIHIFTELNPQPANLRPVETVEDLGGLLLPRLLFLGVLLDPEGRTGDRACDDVLQFETAATRARCSDRG